MTSQPEGVGLPGQATSDRLVQYLSTLVTYPYIYLVIRKLINTKQSHERGKAKLSDFPEGRAIISLERWCRQPVYNTFTAELICKYAQLFRAVILQNVQWKSVRKIVLRPTLIHAAAVPPDYTLEELVQEQLRCCSSHVDILHAVEKAITPNLVFIRETLEQRVTLARGRTNIEFLDLLVDLARFFVSLFFTWLRLLARVLGFFNHILNVMSGILGFTVIFAIALSIVSAWFAFGSLWIYAIADFLEPTVYQGVSWMKYGVERLYSLVDKRFNYGGLVGPKKLPSGTFEGLEKFFDKQLHQTMNLVNRPEIPRLSNDSLLVKCYDCNLVDAQGEVQSKAVSHLLNKAPGPFIATGFFGVAPTRQYKAATVMLVRLLCWKRISLVVNGPDAIRYIVITGADAPTASLLYTKLIGKRADAAGNIDTAPDVGVVNGELSLFAVLLPDLHQAESITQTICEMSACTVVCASLSSEPNAIDMDVILSNLKSRRLCLLCLSSTVTAEASEENWTKEKLNKHIEEEQDKWQGYIDDMALEHSVDSSFCTVMVADVEEDRRWSNNGAKVVQGFDQLKDWTLKGAHGYRRSG